MGMCVCVMNLNFYPRYNVNFFFVLSFYVFFQFSYVVLCRNFPLQFSYLYIKFVAASRYRLLLTTLLLALLLVTQSIRYSYLHPTLYLFISVPPLHYRPNFADYTAFVMNFVYK